jgi:hypothetical protein
MDMFERDVEVRERLQGSTTAAGCANKSKMGTLIEERWEPKAVVPYEKWEPTAAVPNREMGKIY